MANTTGVGAATIVTGADGTGTAVYEGVADPLRLAVADALSVVELGMGAVGEMSPWAAEMPGGGRVDEARAASLAARL